MKNMKKVLVFLAAIAVLAMTAASCNKQSSEIDRIKKECQGQWKGNMSELLGGKEVTVTFSGTKVSTTTNFSANIVDWTEINGLVYATLDDEMKSALGISINGNTMHLTSNSTIVLNFPGTLTRVK